jgi:hypothetical protein
MKPDGIRLLFTPKKRLGIEEVVGKQHAQIASWVSPNSYLPVLPLLRAREFLG